MEIETQEKQHHGKYTYAQKKCGSICTLYGENCNLERHMKWIEVVVIGIIGTKIWPAGIAKGFEKRVVRVSMK